MPPVIDIEKCTKCGICVDFCPVDVYYGSQESEIPTVSYGDDCFFCGVCILECPADAIMLRYPLYAQPSYLPDI
ncbi:ferredoxin family protein [Chloroflexota bacterium]